MGIISSLLDAFNDAMSLPYDHTYSEALQSQEAIEASLNIHQTPSSPSPSPSPSSPSSSSSDHTYAEALQFKEASLYIHQTPLSPSSSSLSSSSSDDLTYAEALQFQEAIEASFDNHQTPSSSSSKPILCEICTEITKKSDMFQLKGCPHTFCFICICKHIEYKLQENIIIISCPDHACKNIMQPQSLKSIIHAQVIDRWEEAIAESTIIASQKIRCPYCLEILVNDGGGVITECECPWCHRLFCAKCKVPWHQGLDCKMFERFHEDKKEKEKLRLLARENKWKKCPNCQVFVDKTEGCIHITCRCKFEFCYVCGGNWNKRHWITCRE